MTEDEAKRKMEAKVAKLLRLAEHPNTPEHERLAASAQAAALMEKYALDELMVAKAAGRETSDVMTKKEYSYTGVYTYADASFVWSLSEACGLKAIRYKKGNSQIKMVVYGFESDFQRFDVLLTSGMLQRVSALNRFVNENGARWNYMTASEKYNARRSFMVGFGSGFASKVAEASRQTQQDVVKERGSGAELVLVERKTQVDKFYKQENPRVGVARGVKITGAYGSGQRAGRSANIGGTGLGGNKRALGG